MVHFASAFSHPVGKGKAEAEPVVVACGDVNATLYDMLCRLTDFRFGVGLGVNNWRRLRTCGTLLLVSVLSLA